MPSPNLHPTTRTVRVFISSTFRDMHAERDHLVTVVFPELRERIERLGLEFFDVDLRWGVPEKNADNEKANSWEYCKQWIDRVEPFFICMLGQRYGWTPDPDEIRDDNDRELYKGLSVTEMEIRHAVLTGKLSRRSYFYFRNTAVPKDIPGEVYDEFVDTDHEKDLEKLKNDILKKSGRPVRKYDCNWTGDGFNAMKAFGALVLEDLWSGILRDERYVDKKWWREADINPETDPLYTDESRPIPEDTWKKIVNLAKPEPKDPLDAERGQMDAFATARLRWFQGRDTELKQLTQFISSTAQDAPRLAVVAAVPGQGKSALLAKLHGELKSSPDFVITHFVGATERSANAYELVKRLLGELDRSGIVWPVEQQQEGQEPKLDFNSLCLKLAQRLGDYAGERRIVILIDALNQLSDGHDLQWLPYRLGSSVRVIVTCVDDEKAKPDSPEQKVLKALQSRQPAPLYVPLGPLSEDDVRTIIEAYLKEYCKELDTPHIDTICAMPQAHNPLYLLVMLGELRTLGGNEMNKKVPELIASMQTDHPDTVSLFRWVLQRLENAEGFGKEAVQWWCLYLAYGRIGMSSKELAELLAIKLGPEAAAIALLIERGMRRYLQRRGPQLDFFHVQLKQAVLEQYGSQIDATTVNADLANYFIEIADPEKNQCWKSDNPRPFLEVAFHLVGADRVDELCQTLCDLRFVEARCRIGQVFALIADYRLAKENLPEAQEELRKEREQRERIQRWTGKIIEYSRQWSERRDRVSKGEKVSEPEPQLPEPPETCRMWTDAEIEAESQRIIENPTRLDRLEAFMVFLESQCYPLLEFGKRQGFVVQHAFTNAPAGPVHESGNALLSTLSIPYIRCVWEAHARYNPKPACIRTLEGHSDNVNSVSMTADGSLAVSGSKDATLRVWDLESGSCLRTIESHTGKVESVTVTPDGRRAVSGSCKPLSVPKWSFEWAVQVWDIDRGTCMRKLEGNNKYPELTPDGKLAVSASSDGVLMVSDLENGSCVRMIGGHTKPVNSVCVTPDGRRAVSGGNDKTVRVWDIENGVCVKTLEGYTGEITSVSITPDGQRAVSGRYNFLNPLQVWDIESGVCLQTLKCNEGGVNSVSITPDGRRALAGGNDKTVRVWDIENGVCVKTLEGHTGEIRSVSISPDGRRAVSGSTDGTIRVWNLENGAYQRILKGYYGRGVKGFCVTPDGLHVLSGNNDSVLRVWYLASGRCIWTLESPGMVNNLIVTSDGKRAVTWTESVFIDKTIQVWDLENGTWLCTLEGHIGGVNSVCLTHDGRNIVSGGVDKTLRIWDLESGKCLLILEGHNGEVTCVSIMPDSRCAVSGGGYKDFTVRVWDMKSGACLKILKGHSGRISTISLTPEGRRAISGSEDNTLRVWDLDRGICIRTLEGHSDQVISLIVNLDGRTAVSGSRDTTLRVWDIESGTCIGMLEGYNGEDLRTNITSNGRIAVLGIKDTALRVWDIESGECMGLFRTTAPVWAVKVFSNTLVIGLSTSEVLFTEMRNIPMGPAIITAFNYQQARCTMCGKEFVPPPAIVEAIRNKDAAELSANCPHCNHALKFNPFFASREG